MRFSQFNISNYSEVPGSYRIQFSELAGSAYMFNVSDLAITFDDQLSRRYEKGEVRLFNMREGSIPQFRRVLGKKTAPVKAGSDKYNEALNKMGLKTFALSPEGYFEVALQPGESRRLMLSSMMPITDGPGVEEYKLNVTQSKLLPSGGEPVLIGGVVQILRVEEAADPCALSSRKFWLGINGGAAIPLADLANGYNTGVHIGADAGFRINSSFSGLLSAGWSRFAPKDSLDNLSILNLSANVHWKLQEANGWHYSAQAGPGVYFSGQLDSSPLAGANIGLKASRCLNDKLRITGGLNAHLLTKEQGSFLTATLGLGFP